MKREKMKITDLKNREQLQRRETREQKKKDHFWITEEIIDLDDGRNKKIDEY